MSVLENQNNILTEWRMLVKLGLLKVKPALLNEVFAIREKLFAPGERIMGVHLRGTDYVSRKPFGHPIPPPVEFAASVIVTKLQEWRCHKIFLATEDKNIEEVFKKIFGDLLITFDKDNIEYEPGEIILDFHNDHKNDLFKLGKDYLTEIILLSTCDTLCSARCSGTLAALLMADHFEHTYFFNLGRYGMITLD